jgi:hypothetical protein
LTRSGEPEIGSPFCGPGLIAGPSPLAPAAPHSAEICSAISPPPPSIGKYNCRPIPALPSINPAVVQLLVAILTKCFIMDGHTGKLCSEAKYSSQKAVEMLTDPTPRLCEYCGARYRPRYPTQKWCRRWCRMQAKAAEGRAARRTWFEAGRPLPEEPVVEEPERHELRKRSVA